MMLSAADIAAMRDTADDALPSVCVIWRDTRSPGPFSTAGSVVASVAGTVACRVRPASRTPDEQASGGVGEVVAPRYWRVSMPVGTDVRADDRIAFDSRVLHVVDGTGDKSWDISAGVLCVETNAGAQ